MNGQHFNALDLNLLRVFDALLEERNVTRAGARLGLTQSAVSHALGRLRFALGDPLFLRRPSGMEPTARAVEIGPAVHAALLQLQTTLGPARFEPTTAHRAFHVVAGAYASATLMPALIERMHRIAPQVQLKLLDGRARLIEGLDAGRIDAVIGSFDGVPERYAEERLLTETMVWVVRGDHPEAGRRLTLAQLASLTHVVIASLPELNEPPDGSLRRHATWEDTGALKRELEREGLERRVGVVAPDTFTALAIVARSDMAAQAPRRLAEVLVRNGRVALLDAPFTPPSVEISMLYRRDRALDPAQAWFLGLLRETAAELE